MTNQTGFIHPCDQCHSTNTEPLPSGYSGGPWKCNDCGDSFMPKDDGPTPEQFQAHEQRMEQAWEDGEY